MSQHPPPPYPPPVVVKVVTANTIGLGILLGAVYIALVSAAIGTLALAVVLVLEGL